MRLLLSAAALFLASASFAASAAPTPSPDPRLDHSYAFPQSGWTYVHLEGTPAQIGFQHGYLLHNEIEDVYRTYKLEDERASKKPWSFFRTTAREQLWPNIEPEYRAELQGIADGLKARDSKLDVWDVVAINAHLEVPNYYVPWHNAQTGKTTPAALVAPGKCSAFIATGSATKDGKIVIAHSNWSPYIEGERWTIIFDIVPARGNHILMDGAAGLIHSGDDFGVNSAGIMITETTLPMAKGWDPTGVPEFVRARKAMQYANSIDDFASIMRDRNNGGYANSWLVGDRKTNEIAYLELGLRHTPLTRKQDGYFVSSNFPANPDLIRDDTPGFDTQNMASTMNARHVRAEEFMQQHLGKLDTDLAEAYLSDHYDSFEHKLEPGRRSLCGHEEKSKDPESAWDSPPFEPSGAVTGKVMDSTLASKMSFIARAGHPCGDDFHAKPFLSLHPEFAWQQPVMRDMPAGPWTAFAPNQQQPQPAASGTR